MYWPKEDGAGLGLAGTWNLLFRVGALPKIIEVSNLHSPKDEDVLFVTADTKFSFKTEQKLQEWMAGGGRVVATGCPEAWRFVFPQNATIENARPDNPVSALVWLQDDKEPELVSPPKWTYLKVKKNGHDALKCRGKLAMISGERQTPDRALVRPLVDAPAILHIGNFYYFNGNPFGALQAWMQGQEDLEPWLAWRHRIFWLDEYSGFLIKTLQKYQLLPEIRNGIPGLAKTTIVFKHDLDYSRDTTYLNMETQAGLSGVHPILKDNNTKFWVKILKSNQNHESAFHFSTGRYSRLWESIRHYVLNLPKNPNRPNRSAIKGNGLLDQVKWAKKNSVGIETLHRHSSFIFYPEFVDALDTVYNNELEVLGSNSFFRSQVLRWGTDHIEHPRGTLGYFPDPQFPYWFPFRLAHAGHGGNLLKGWESTSMMECEPGLVEQMLNYKIPGLPQKVLVFNYHPAHANTPTFTSGGCANWFRETLDLCKQHNVEVKTLAEVYRTMNAAL